MARVKELSIEIGDDLRAIWFRLESIRQKYYGLDLKEDAEKVYELEEEICKLADRL